MSAQVLLNSHFKLQWMMHKGSYMSAQVLLNLLNELSLFCNELNKELRALRGKFGSL